MRNKSCPLSDISGNSPYRARIRDGYYENSLCDLGRCEVIVEASQRSSSVEFDSVLCT